MGNSPSNNSLPLGKEQKEMKKPTGRQIIDQFKLHVLKGDESKTFLQYLKECKQRAINLEDYEWAQRLHDQIEKYGASPQ